MNDAHLQLTYREIAERLGLSPDAARMKAKRAVKAGKWRIIPGNHPNDPVRVEMPATDIERAEPVGGERSPRSGGEQKGRTLPRTAEEPVLANVLQSAQARIAELTDELIKEKDRHRETAIALAQAETREMAAAGDIERLEGTVAQLHDDLRRAQRSWWRRLKG